MIRRKATENFIGQMVEYTKDIVKMVNNTEKGNTKELTEF